MNDKDEYQESEDSSETISISDLSKRGYQLLKENYIDEAVECFVQIIEVDEANNYALVGLGDAARKKRDFRKAVTYYQECLDHHPGNNYALFGLADCYKALNQYKQAIEIWEQYLKHDDGNVTVLTRVADAYRKVKDFRRSKEIYQRALKAEEDNAYALIGLGHLHYDFREYDQALLYWGKMFEFNENNVDIRVLTSIGNCHRKLKTFHDGLGFFQMALDLEPHNFYALFGMADCYRGLNDQPNSLIYWNKILSRDPNNKVILTRAGETYRNMAQYDEAEEHYKAALNIEFDEYAILGLALISKMRGNYRDAIVSLKGLLKNDAKNHRLYTEIAECHLKLKERNQAIEILNEFQQLGIRNSYVSEMLSGLSR
ncbi:MAG: tetratricopeptide repeat protein [Spirochaetales bacterium]|jgi:tetratricopeptide (TPR) repeat protein|nr:tetratricopeptide repeat protein [Spirochaetales bacterium]